MFGNQRRCFWIEPGLSTATALLAIITLISREWIELLTGWNPDHGDGSLEWAIVVLAVVALISGAVARPEWMRTATAAGS